MSCAAVHLKKMAIMTGVIIPLLTVDCNFGPDDGKKGGGNADDDGPSTSDGADVGKDDDVGNDDLPGDIPVDDDTIPSDDVDDDDDDGTPSGPGFDPESILSDEDQTPRVCDFDEFASYFKGTKRLSLADQTGETEIIINATGSEVLVAELYDPGGHSPKEITAIRFDRFDGTSETISLTEPQRYTGGPIAGNTRTIFTNNDYVISIDNLGHEITYFNLDLFFGIDSFRSREFDGALIYNDISDLDATQEMAFLEAAPIVAWNFNTKSDKYAFSPVELFPSLAIDEPLSKYAEGLPAGTWVLSRLAPGKNYFAAGSAVRLSFFDSEELIYLAATYAVRLVGDSAEPVMLLDGRAFPVLWNNLLATHQVRWPCGGEYDICLDQVYLMNLESTEEELIADLKKSTAAVGMNDLGMLMIIAARARPEYLRQGMPVFYSYENKRKYLLSNCICEKCYLTTEGMFAYEPLPDDAPGYFVQTTGRKVCFIPNEAIEGRIEELQAGEAE